jgi:uncharacterized protein (DUF1778 family)
MPRLVAQKQAVKKQVAHQESPESTKEDRLSIRANARQKTVLAQAAKARHMNVSQFVLQASLTEAERILKEETQIIVSAEEYEWLCRLLDAPPQPLPRLKEALGQKPVWDE